MRAYWTTRSSGSSRIVSPPRSHGETMATLLGVAATLHADALTLTIDERPLA